MSNTSTTTRTAGQPALAPAPSNLARQLTDAVDTYRDMRMNSAGRTVRGPSARARHAADMKRRRQRITRLVDQARAAGIEVRDEIDTPFDDYRCRECGYFGRMTLRRDLVANKQMRVCPSCGEDQRSRRRPVY